ncbi:MAG TPA: hypothetical protein VL381_03275, partial [Rhodocyclaceae bacterium]|nr:hypothetical protein [Rhodocyclaceae bacterium]
IGPLEPEETRGYVLHRLKCAGATDKPRFQEDAFVAIHRASGGIPRRINAICDRLLLLGFLSEIEVFSQVEVDEVAAEVNDKPLNNITGVDNERLLAPAAIDESFDDADLAQLSVDEKTASEVAQAISGLQVRKNDERLIRLERSLLRLERGHSIMLNLLQRLVNAARVRSSDSDVPPPQDK